MLWDALREDISRRVGKEAAGRLASYLQGRLLKDGGVFLLNGLDEVPEAERRREVVLGSIRALAATLPDAARLLVTARPYAYAEKKWHLPGFPILALAPFSPEQVERFIERWYRAARQPMGWSEETARDQGRPATGCAPRTPLSGQSGLAPAPRDAHGDPAFELGPAPRRPRPALQGGRQAPARALATGARGQRTYGRARDRARDRAGPECRR